MTLPLTGGISGTVTSGSALSLDGVYVQVVDATEGPFGDVAYAMLEQDGTDNISSLEPGEYKVLFVDGGFDQFYGPEWYDDANYATAEVVSVVSVKTKGGIDAELEEGMRALVRSS